MNNLRTTNIIDLNKLTDKEYEARYKAIQRKWNKEK